MFSIKQLFSKKLGSLLLMACLLYSCELSKEGTTKKLPILGEKETVNGEIKYHEVPDFSFINQDSQVVNNNTFNEKLYIVDFFFTSCPTICPKVTQQMLRIHDKFVDEEQVVLLAHSIDQKRDTVGRLKWYADKLEVKTDKWHFVTGKKEEIYAMADEYFIIAKEDSEAPGGFDHSGTIILVDKNRRVRSFCNGIDPEEVDRFMEDVQTLLNES